MLIATDKPGQLGNQLWAYANLAAIGKDSKKKVIILLQENYFRLLDQESLEKAKTSRVFIYDASSAKARSINKWVLRFTAGNKQLWRKLLRYFLRVSLIKEYNECSDRKMRSQKKIFLVNSWEQRVNNHSLIRENEFIRSVILPEQESRKKAEQQINKWRAKHKTLIAVHIRRGDYLHFREGKYYFDDEVYREKMEQVDLLFKKEETAFCIFSNEEIDLSHFAGLNVYHDNTNTAIGDMWAISLCDYIMGPLSTFSMWASFWKKVPLLFIEKDLVINSTDLFRPVIAQDVQLDKKIIA